MIELLLYTILYVIGWIIAYVFITRYMVQDSCSKKMDDFDRPFAIFGALFSWVAVALIIVVFIIYKSALFFKPFLSKLEPKQKGETIDR